MGAGNQFGEPYMQTKIHRGIKDLNNNIYHITKLA